MNTAHSIVATWSPSCVFPRWSWSVALGVAGLVGAGGLPARAQPVAPRPAAAPADDPFAEELNPFGRETTTEPRPAEAPVLPMRDDAGVPPPATRRPQLPVPFPDTTDPGRPAAKRPRMAPREMREDPGAGWEPSPAQPLLIEAEKLDREGRFEEARDKLLEVVKTDPKLTLGYLALGVVSRRLGDFEGSVDALSKGLAIDPQDSELYLRRGIAWYHLGLYGIALEDFEDAAGIAYDDPRPELWRGLTLVELGRPLEAINAYASAIRRDRTFMLAYLNRGLAYLSTDEPRKAEFDFNQAIRHDPKDVRAWFNRGVAQARQGRFSDAANSYGEALKRDPKHDPSRRNLEAARGRAGSSASTTRP